MIANNDRSGFIGASDTKYVVGNWKTKSFEKWWLEKLGLNKNNFSNKYTLAGTNWEHKILDFINADQKDLQVIVGKLRVNIDGLTNKTIQEIKTYNYNNGFILSKDYIEQCQVEMLGFKTKKCEIIAYGLLEKDYYNYFRDVDKNRLSYYKIKYDKEFIKKYKPRLKYLSLCLEKGAFPKEEDINNL